MTLILREYDNNRVVQVPSDGYLVALSGVTLWHYFDFITTFVSPSL